MGESRFLRRRKIRLLWAVVSRNNVRKKETKKILLGEILLFLKEWSIGATDSGIKTLEVQKKLRLRESKLHWESVRGWEGIFTIEFWTSGAVGGA